MGLIFFFFRRIKRSPAPLRLFPCVSSGVSPAEGGLEPKEAPVSGDVILRPV